MKIKLSKILFFTSLVAILFGGISVVAQAAEDKSLDKLQNIAKNVGFTTVDTANPNAAQERLGILIGTIIGSFLIALGLVYLIMIFSAGWIWMNAQGNEEQVNKAKKIIITSSIGVIIVGLAYALTKILGFILTGAGLFQK